MPSSKSVSAQSILKAAEHMAGIARRTPLEASAGLSALTGGEVRLKLENLQLTGSFKLRGAINVLANLSEAERRAGVIAPTAGNHGMGLSHAGKALDIPVTICLPASADPMKLAAMRAAGARIETFDDIEAARQAAQLLATRDGAVFVSAYDNPHMIAGGGTVGLEIVQDWGDVDTIVVPIGGGGLASGIATIAKALNPAVEIWAVQSDESPTFIRWKEMGETVSVDLHPSVGEGISGYIEPGTMTWPMVRDRVDRVLPVSDVQIRQAMRVMLEAERHVVEPSGAAAVAAVLRYAPALQKRKVAVVVTGRNVGADRYLSLLA